MELPLDAPRILIVDNDVSVHAGIAMPLFEAGYITATTRHKEEALALLIEQPYDAIILDPFEGGGMLELLQLVRSDELLGYPHVILLTSQSARARDAVNNGWADIAFDKDDVDWYALAQAIGDLLASA